MCGGTGDWAQRVAHPSAGLTKEYVVNLDRKPSRPELEVIAAGTTVDGVFVQPEWVMPILDDPRLFRIRIVVKEGRNREVSKFYALPAVSNLTKNARPSTIFFLHVRECSALTTFCQEGHNLVSPGFWQVQTAGQHPAEPEGPLPERESRL